MTWAAAVLMAAVFMLALRWLRVAGRARQVFDCTKTALAVIRDKRLDDLDKERALRRHALQLLGYFGLSTMLLVTALAVAAVPVLTLHGLDMVEAEQVFDRTMTWTFWLVAAALGAVVAAIPRAKS